MDQILKEELRLSHQLRLRIVVGLLIFAGLLFVCCYGLYVSSRTVIREQSSRSIENISQLNRDAVTRAIKNREILLETISEKLEKRNEQNIALILNELKEFEKAYDFYRIGILDKEDHLHLVDGTVLDATTLPKKSMIWDGEFHISESYIPVDGGNDTKVMFSYPVYYGDDLKYVLIATYYSKYLTERMNTTSLSESGHTFLMDRQGKIVVYPECYEDDDYNAMMKYIDDTSEIVPKENGSGSFSYKGETYYAYFENLGINEWYLMTCAKESDVLENANTIHRNSILAIGVILLLSIFSTCAVLYITKRSKRELMQTVYYDELLHIGNGNYLSLYYDKLTPEQMEHMCAVVFDIDKFKEFNYLYGDETGDRLLKYIVRVFQEELPELTIVRYVSDYFVTLDKCQGRAEYEEKIKKILARFESDIDLGIIPPFTISAGVRKLQTGEPLRRIISDALIAKLTVKGNHMQHYAFYEVEIRDRRMAYMEMESQFASAMRNKEFHTYYQPKYDMRTGRIVGAEALARWIKPDGRMLLPTEFVPCFEQSHQICLLDEEMLREVCRHMKEMEAEGLDMKTVSVNLSRVHLRHPGILPMIKKIIEESGVHPEKLSFEITESALYEDSDALKMIVDYLHGLGCTVELDDYGIGVSGPSALAVNRFDLVKLDKSFIDGIGDEHIEDVIASTIQLANKWGTEVLAEGIEQKYQVDRLVELGCRLGQGFYYSEAVSKEDYKRLLLSEKSSVVKMGNQF